MGSAAVEQEALTWFNAKADGFDIAVIDIFLKAGGGEKVFDKSTELEELVVWVQDRRPAPGH